MFRFLRRTSPIRPATPEAAPAAPAASASKGFLPQSLAWPVLRRLDGLSQGNHETLLQGPGMRLSDIREYLPGDDVRHIDWNVTARTGTLHVRTFYEERELTAWFLIDTSASMAFSSTGAPKYRAAQQCADMLASLFVRQADRFAALFHDGYGASPAVTLPPGAGQQHQMRLARLFAEHAGRAPSTAPSGRTNQAGSAGGTPLSPMLRRACAAIRRRSLVIVLSDFLAAPGWEDWLRQLAYRHEVLCVRVIDPVERSIPDIGLITVEDSESGSQCLIDTSDPVIRSRYTQIVADRDKALADICLGAGADLLGIQTSMPLAPQLVAYLSLRKKRRHLPARNRARS
ncbi:MAG: DUF58 domain-containing protein [Burkholderiaceae bacterium]